MSAHNGCVTGVPSRLLKELDEGEEIKAENIQSLGGTLTRYRIQFGTPRHATAGAIPTRVGPEQALVMEQEVDTLLRKEAIEVVPPVMCVFYLCFVAVYSVAHLQSTG